MAVFFGAQSFGAYAIMGWLAQLYRDAGYSAETAGLLLACTAVAYLGLAVAPHRGIVVWTVLLAIGQGCFPLVLAMFGMRARTAAGTVALSAFAQSAGYLIAALGPLAIGLLYEATGAWVAPLAVLGGALVVQTIAGFAAGRPRTVEDELDSYPDMSS